VSCLSFIFHFFSTKKNYDKRGGGGGLTLVVTPGLLHARLDSLLVLAPVLLEQLGRHGVGGGVGVGITQQRLNAGQNGRNIISGRPSVLEDVEADASIRIDVGVEHFGEEFDYGWLIGVLLAELHRELESAVLKRGLMRPKYNRIPEQNVIFSRGSTHSCRRILLQPFEVSHKAPPGCSGHVAPPPHQRAPLHRLLLEIHFNF